MAKYRPEFSLHPDRLTEQSPDLRRPGELAKQSDQDIMIQGLSATPHEGIR
jgi:hypothetical protein